jgi:hypothetical protein
MLFSYLRSGPCAIVYSSGDARERRGEAADAPTTDDDLGSFVTRGAGWILRRHGVHGLEPLNLADERLRQ